MKVLLNTEEFDFLHDLGIVLKSIEDKERSTSAISKHFSVLCIKAELDQLLCGLAETLGALHFIRSEPTVMKTLFVYTEGSPIRADDMFDMFTIQYSPAGSTSREREEATSMLWYHLLEVIDYTSVYK